MRAKVSLLEYFNARAASTPETMDAAPPADGEGGDKPVAEAMKPAESDTQPADEEADLNFVINRPEESRSDSDSDEWQW